MTAATPQQTINNKALIWTIGVHILLFLLFMLFRYTLPVVAPVQELGMEVNLGSSDNGSGKDQPMAVDMPASERSEARRSSARQSNAAKDMMQSDDANAPTINTPNKSNKTTRNNTANNDLRHKNVEQAANNHKTQQQEHPKYVYNGSTGKGGNGAPQNAPGSSEGNTTGNGDRGVPGGTPGASNYTGSPGNGTGGVSHTLTGRDISPNRFEAEFNEGGTVKIRVTVNRDGAIVNKTIVSSPSAQLSRLAIEKLSRAKFSANASAAPQQFGYVTIVFKAHS